MGAITHGPLVYCQERVDNSDINFEEVVVDTSSIKLGQPLPGMDDAPALCGETMEGKALFVTPNNFWGNRSQSHMSVCLHIVE